MKPHKHAELIKAWADGAEIQYTSSLDYDEWTDCPAPQWGEQSFYRIKPKQKPTGAYFYAFRSPTDVGNMTTNNYGECNLKLIWKDGKLINAEVIA